MVTAGASGPGRQPNTIFRAFRRSLGTQQEAADHLNAVAADLGVNLGCTVQQIRRLENGTTQWPNRDYRQVLVAASGRVLNDLGFQPRHQHHATKSPSSQGISPTQRQRDYAAGTSAVELQQDAHGAVAWPATIDEARTAATALWTEGSSSLLTTDRDPAVSTAAFQWLIAPPDAPPSRDGGWRRIGPSDVARLRGVRQRLKAMDNTLGGGAALPMATAYLRREAAPLIQGRYNADTGRRLLEVLAELTLDVGWMAYDADTHHVAQRWFLHALRLSHAAEATLLGGRILTAMSHQALHLGHTPQAVDLANAARRGTEGQATPRTVAMLAAMQACAYATRGDSELCTRALGDTEDALSAATDNSDDPDWLDFDHGGYWGHAARAHRDLHHGQRAEQYAARSVTLCHQDHGRTRAQRAAIQASAHVQLGNDDAAAALGLQIIHDAWNLHSSHVYGEIATLVSLVRPARETREFHDQAEEFLTARAPERAK